MKRALIIGASGFLGGTIYYKLNNIGVNVLGTYSSKKKQSEYVKLDVLDTGRLIELIKDYIPDVIIWTVMNHDLEEEIAEKVMPAIRDTVGNIRFIFMSTSVAYEKNMSEDVQPYLRSEDMYNYHYFNGKIKSENVIKTMQNYCIVRPGSIYGTDPYGEMDMRSRLLKEHVDSGEKYIRASNIIFSVVEVNELADAVIELANSDYIGIINVSEEKPVSHYDFNKALCKRYGWSDDCLEANEESENIYYLNNDLRKRLLKTRIGSII